MPSRQTELMALRTWSRDAQRFSKRGRNEEDKCGGEKQVSSSRYPLRFWIRHLTNVRGEVESEPVLMSVDVTSAQQVATTLERRRLLHSFRKLLALFAHVFACTVLLVHSPTCLIWIGHCLWISVVL